MVLLKYSEKMVGMKNILFMTFILPLLLVACGGKSEKKTTAKVIIGALGELNSTLSGGFFLFGQNNSNGRRFHIRVQDASAEFELTNGNWTIGAYGWTGGSGTLTGSLKCSQEVNINLSGVEPAPINLDVRDTNCTAGIYGPPGSSSGSLYKPSQLFVCAGIERDINKHISTFGGSPPEFQVTCEDEELVSARYIQVTMYKIDFGGAISPELTSPCMAMPADSNPFDPSTVLAGNNLVLPLYSFVGAPLEVVISKDPSCASNSDIVFFPSGLGSFADGLRGFSQVTSTSYNSIIVDNSICTYAQGALAAETTGVYHLCNASHIEDLATNVATFGASGNTVILAQDIDINGANNTPIGNGTNRFQAEFNGDNRTIFNGTNALFGQISGDASIEELSLAGFSLANEGIISGVFANQIVNGGGSPARIEKVTIVNSSNTGNTANGTSGFIGQVTDAAFELRDITINNVNIDSSANGTGLLIGAVLISTAGSPQGSVSKVRVYDSDVDGQSKVGSIVGEYLTSGGAAYNLFLHDIEVYDTYVVGDDGTSNHIGGIIGIADTSLTAASSFGSKFVSLDNNPGFEIVGGSNTGGFAGRILSTNSNQAKLDKIYIYSDINADVTNAVGKIAGIVGDASNVFANDLTYKGYMFGTIGTAYVDIGGIMGQMRDDSFISNAHSIVDIDFDGDKLGGIVGYNRSVTAGMGVYHSLAEGTISTPTTSFAGNTNRGGLIGVNEGMVGTSLSYVDVEGYSFVGGAIGRNQGAGTSAFDLFSIGEVTVENDTAGGLVGLNDGNAVITDSITRSNVNAISLCSGSCGKLIGDNLNNLNDRLVAENTMTNTSDNSASYSGATALGATTLIDTFVDGSTIFTDDGTWGHSGTDILLLSLEKIKEFVPSFDYKLGVDAPPSGNYFDPYPISNEDDWNSIGDDAKLVSKSYYLNSSIAFTSFNSIGGAGNPFKGSLFGEGFSLSGIVLDDSSGGSVGVFKNTENAIIGESFSPLIINDITLATSGPTLSYVGGLIGHAIDSDVSVHILNVSLNEANPPSACQNAGGLIGYSQGTKVDNSVLSGSVILPTCTNVGGLIGVAESSTPGGDRHYFIKDTAVSLQSINGDNVGGFIHTFNTTNSYIEMKNVSLEFKTGASFTFANSGAGFILESNSAGGQRRIDSVVIDLYELGNISSTFSDTFINIQNPGALEQVYGVHLVANGMDPLTYSTSATSYLSPEQTVFGYLDYSTLTSGIREDNEFSLYEGNWYFDGLKYRIQAP